MIKYSHHLEYCNSIGFSAEVSVESRQALVAVFEWLMNTAKHGEMEVYTPEMFSGEDWEDKIAEMKRDIAKDLKSKHMYADPNNLPMFTGEQGGWEGDKNTTSKKFDPENETITCIVKAPEWFAKIHGHWIMIVQNNQTGKLDIRSNGGYLGKTEMYEDLMKQLNHEMTADVLDHVAKTDFKKLAQDVVVEEDEDSLDIYVSPRMSEFVRNMRPMHKG